MGRKGDFSIPEGVEIIDEYAFSQSSLSEVILPDSLTEIKDHAFSKSALAHIEIPSCVEKIGCGAFKDSLLESVILNEGLKEIRTNAFKAENLKEIYLPDSLQECGTEIVCKGTSVSASYPTKGLYALSLEKNVTFRDESTLQRAVRYSEKFNNERYYGGKGRIFVDLTDDNFPELITNHTIYYFDFEKDSWQCDQFFDGDLLLSIEFEDNPDLYICYDKETDTKRYYSAIELCGYRDNIYEYQNCIVIKDNKIVCETYYNDDVKDISELDVIGTFNVTSLLEGYTYDKFEDFVLITSHFADEPYGEIDESKPLLWRNNEEIRSFPYFSSYYDDSVSLTVAGKDILRGEKVEGVSYKGDTLTLDNVDIELDPEHRYAVSCSGLPYLTVNLIGDNKISGENLKSFFNVYDIGITIEGDGTLETPTLRAENLTIKGKAKVTETISLMDSERAFANTLKVIENGEFCSNFILCENISLSDNGKIKTKRAEYIRSLYLKGNSYMEIIMDEDYSNWYSGGRAIDCVQTIEITDNAKLYTENKGCETIFCYPNYAKVKVSGKGILEIKGNPASIGLSLDDSAFGTLVINDEATVKITDAGACVYAQKIIINGGTLECHSAKGGGAVFIDKVVSPYAKFVPGLYINGEIISQSCDNWETAEIESYADAIVSDGKVLEDFSLTVKQKPKES